jgi:hypothetical protein
MHRDLTFLLSPGLQLAWNLALACLLLAEGCGSGAPADQPELGEVTGVVTLDGKPLPNVIVTFNPAKGRPSIGTTDEMGSYTLSYLGHLDGAVVGPNTVTIATPQDHPDPPGHPFKDPIPAKYNNETTLTADVKPGANEFNFDLLSK